VCVEELGTVYSNCNTISRQRIHDVSSQLVGVNTLKIGHCHGRPQNFSQGGEADILLIFFRLLAMQRKWTYTKRKCPMLRQTVANSVFPGRKLYTEQMFVLVSMNILRLSWQSSRWNRPTICVNIESKCKIYENTNKVTFNSNSFSLFSCFSNVLECLKLHAMRFRANGLVDLHICAPSERGLIAKNFRNASFSLMFLYT